VFNIVFNLYNKSALNLFPYPWFMSTLQLAAGVVWMCALWLFRLQPLPKVPNSFFLAVIPVAFFHTVGHVSACCAFSQVRPLSCPMRWCLGLG
jgi:solute carrier family 35 protein E1